MTAFVLIKPSNKSLKILKTDLQNNARLLYWNLGLGDHGYLVLVIIYEEYAIITNT